MNQKVALVTGGGGNIGKEIARELSRRGASVWIVERDEPAGAEVVQGIRAEGGTAQLVEADVTDPGDAERAVGEVLQTDGGIDVLVNNVGGSFGLSLEDIDEDAFQRNIDLNLKSAVFMTKATCPSMRDRGGGSVIFISSVNALLGGFGQVAYAAAKAALHSLVQTLTAEYSPDGLRFNALCVGSVPGDSPEWREREQADPGTLESLARLYPLRRVGRPSDVAAAVAFLASDQSGWITGTVIPVDGGISATGALPGGQWWSNLPLPPE
jgi:NAD(P)-dependent dehydrogenase (short-subunit alcohol dehydrogenase family)